MGIKGLITSIGNIVSLLIPISVGIALLVFFWGLAVYIYKSDDVSSKKEGKNKMIWGVVALFVMVSVWGLVKFLQNELGIVNNALPGKPINTGGGTGGDGGSTNPPPGGTGTGGGSVPPCGPNPIFGNPCL